jgi:hypothetical protein
MNIQNRHLDNRQPCKIQMTEIRQWFRDQCANPLYAVTLQIMPTNECPSDVLLTHRKKVIVTFSEYGSDQQVQSSWSSVAQRR